MIHPALKIRYPKRMTTPKIRTRFAPSPTGHLHLGGARTALFNWLFAQHVGGEFILRIEDTDQLRSTKAATEAILRSLEWLKLPWHHTVYFQSQRMQRYAQAIDQLLSTDQAYRCYCSKERLAALKEQQIADKIKPRYDGYCRDLGPQDLDTSYVIRFRHPTTGHVTLSDLIRGPITFNNQELDDLILARSDGQPTYNLTCVVDDSDMEISHVIRGDDHINNTPRQIHIFHALGAPVPQYAHLPMILGHDGARLSKRHAATSLLAYREEGFLPDALVNYLLRLGWSHGDQEIFSREEMIQYFNLTSVNKSPASFDPKKLLWMNQQYLKTTSSQALVIPFIEQLKKQGLTIEPEEDVTESVIAAQVGRYKTLEDIAKHSHYFYSIPNPPAEEHAAKYLVQAMAAPLQTLFEQFSELTDWQPEPIQHIIVTTAHAHQLKLGQLAQPLRLSVTGNIISPSIDTTVYLIGKAQVLQRLKRAIDFINHS